MNDASTHAGDACIELALSKGGHRWVFRYRSGEEAAVLRCIARAAADPAQDLDWSDASILARQMGWNLSASLKEFP